MRWEASVHEVTASGRKLNSARSEADEEKAIAQAQWFVDWYKADGWEMSLPEPGVVRFERAGRVVEVTIERKET